MNNLNNLENNLEQPTEKNQENSNNLWGTLSKCLTFAPLMLEQLTGQKVPQMTGTLGEIQQNINHLNTNLQLMVNNQNKIWQKLTSLENNANQKLVNLTRQIDKISTVKLTHTQEKKQIEFNPNQRLTNQEYQ